MQVYLANPARTFSFHEKFRYTLTLGACNFLFLLAAFPYICPVNLGFDTQPFALLFSVVLLVVVAMQHKSLKLNTTVFGLLVLFGCAFLYFLIHPSFISARSLAGYASLFFVTYASYLTSKHMQVKCFNFAVYVWLIVGCVQLMGDKYFLSFLLPRMSTTDIRGVTSLAVEPSYYAIICVFLLTINDLLKGVGKQSAKKHIIITVMLLLQIVITKSGLGFVFLLVYFCSKALSWILRDGLSKHIGKLFLLILCMVGTVIAFLSVDTLQYSRAGQVLGLAIEDPRILLLSDASIADRLTGAILSYYSLPYSFGIGLGLGTWGDHFPDLRSYAGGFIEQMAQLSPLGATRIMSGWGTAVYELGIFGLVYLVLFWRVVVKGWKKKNELSVYYVSSGVTLFLMMSMAVPLAFPLFGYAFGMYMHHSYKN